MVGSVFFFCVFRIGKLRSALSPRAQYNKQNSNNNNKKKKNCPLWCQWQAAAWKIWILAFSQSVMILIAKQASSYDIFSTCYMVDGFWAFFKYIYQWGCLHHHHHQSRFTGQQFINSDHSTVSTVLTMSTNKQIFENKKKTHKERNFNCNFNDWQSFWYISFFFFCR